MNIDIGKTIRISDIIDAKDGRSLLLDTTIASTLGATAGIENLHDVLKQVNEHCDGIIVNPGQAEHQAELLGGKRRAAPIIRVDWTNAYRTEDFALPVSNVKRLMISSGEDALNLGASAVLASLLLGFDDDFESTNIRELSLLARECQRLFLPLIVDIRPIGERVAENNFEDSIKLGASFMLELGADALVIPECQPVTYQFIAEWMKVPVLIHLEDFPVEKDAEKIFSAGMAGIVLSESIFRKECFSEKLEALHTKIHE